MKVLVVLVHYFSPEAQPRHSSVDGTRRADRKRAIERTIQGYRALFGPVARARYEQKLYACQPASPVTVDLRLLTMDGCSLVEPDFLDRWGVQTERAAPEDPRFLGYGVNPIFDRHRDDYDWFVYSEDDLLVFDPGFFDKLLWFNRCFGDTAVLSPNRAEINPSHFPIKTYVDDALPADILKKIKDFCPGPDSLEGDFAGRHLAFERAANPHAGLHAISAAQLKVWMSRDYWGHQNSVFISPLESAATLGLMRTFPVYKPTATSASFLEVEHLDSRFSGHDWPRIEALRSERGSGEEIVA